MFCEQLIVFQAFNCSIFCKLPFKCDSKFHFINLNCSLPFENETNPFPERKNPWLLVINFH